MADETSEADDLGRRTGPVGSTAIGTAAVAHCAPATTALAARTPRVVPHELRLVASNVDQRLVDLRFALSGDFASGRRKIGEEVVELAADQDVLVQRHGPAFRHDDRHVAAYLGQPFAELLGVAHRRRERHQLNGIREADDHFLPDGTAEAVSQVVHFVQHHITEVCQRG